MILDVVPEGQFVAGRSMRLAASLLIVRHDDGTILGVAGAYGPGGTVLMSHHNDKDFQSTLRRLGVNETVLCDTIQLPGPPSGYRLIAGPGQ